MRIFTLGGHLGEAVSALVDGQLDTAVLGGLRLRIGHCASLSVSLGLRPSGRRMRAGSGT